jgi:hypothetical protein
MQKKNILSPFALQEPTLINKPSVDDDIFDPSRLRLSQDFQFMTGVRKALITVEVGKPHRQWFVRVHPGEEWRLQVALLEDKTDSATYLVDPALFGEFHGEIVAKMIFTAINRQGGLFLWPVKLPSPEGRLDTWNASALQAADMAMKAWVRVASNHALSVYEVFEAKADLPDPVWPDIGFAKVLHIAFDGKFIRTKDHPALRKLRGEL